MLTKEEMETIINYNQADTMASCYTHDKSLQRRLDALMQSSPDITAENKEDGAKEYTFPKKWVKVKMPRILSDEKRAKLAEQAKHNFKITEE